MSSVPSVSPRQMLVWQGCAALGPADLPTVILGRFLYELPKRQLANVRHAVHCLPLSAGAHLFYVRHLRGWRACLPACLVTAAHVCIRLRRHQCWSESRCHR